MSGNKVMFPISEGNLNFLLCSENLEGIFVGGIVNIRNECLFSAPEPKAQVHYCDHKLSVVRRLSVRPSVIRPSSVCPSLTFHIFDFSSDTAERNSRKLDRKQDINILYQVCVFRADQKNKMAALASDWLRHFRLLL